MPNPVFTFTATIWIWTSSANGGRWHFLSVEGAGAEEIKAHAALARLELGLAKKRGWGAVKVEATIGKTVWRTSIFPDKDSGGFLLPVKASVRKAERLQVDDKVTVQIELV